MDLYWRGLRFGMLLQLAIGPMCLMVFGAARDNGLAAALTLVSALALVDASCHKNTAPSPYASTASSRNIRPAA